VTAYRNRPEADDVRRRGLIFYSGFTVRAKKSSRDMRRVLCERLLGGVHEFAGLPLFCRRSRSEPRVLPVRPLRRARAAAWHRRPVADAWGDRGSV